MFSCFSVKRLNSTYSSCNIHREETVQLQLLLLTDQLEQALASLNKAKVEKLSGFHFPLSVEEDVANGNPRISPVRAIRLNNKEHDPPLPHTSSTVSRFLPKIPPESFSASESVGDGNSGQYESSLDLPLYTDCSFAQHEEPGGTDEQYYTEKAAVFESSDDESYPSTLIMCASAVPTEMSRTSSLEYSESGNTHCTECRSLTGSAPLSNDDLLSITEPNVIDNDHSTMTDVFEEPYQEESSSSDQPCDTEAGRLNADYTSSSGLGETGGEESSYDWCDEKEPGSDGEPVTLSSGFDDEPVASSSGFDDEPVASSSGFDEEPVASSSGSEDEPVTSSSGSDDEPVASSSGFDEEPVTSSSGFDEEPITSSSGSEDEPVASSSGSDDDDENSQSDSSHDDCESSRCMGIWKYVIVGLIISLFVSVCYLWPYIEFGEVLKPWSGIVCGGVQLLCTSNCSWVYGNFCQRIDLESKQNTDGIQHSDTQMANGTISFIADLKQEACPVFNGSVITVSVAVKANESLSSVAGIDVENSQAVPLHNVSLHMCYVPNHIPDPVSPPESRISLSDMQDAVEMFLFCSSITSLKTIEPIPHVYPLVQLKSNPPIWDSFVCKVPNYNLKLKFQKRLAMLYKCYSLCNATLLAESIVPRMSLLYLPLATLSLPQGLDASFIHGVYTQCNAQEHADIVHRPKCSRSIPQRKKIGKGRKNEKDKGRSSKDWLFSFLWHLVELVFSVKIRVFLFFCLVHPVEAASHTFPVFVSTGTLFFILLIVIVFCLCLRACTIVEDFLCFLVYLLFLLLGIVIWSSLSLKDLCISLVTKKAATCRESDVAQLPRDHTQLVASQTLSASCNGNEDKEKKEESPQPSQPPSERCFEPCCEYPAIVGDPPVRSHPIISASPEESSNVDEQGRLPSIAVHSEEAHERSEREMVTTSQESEFKDPPLSDVVNHESLFTLSGDNGSPETKLQSVKKEARLIYPVSKLSQIDSLHKTPSYEQCVPSEVTCVDQCPDPEIEPEKCSTQPVVEKPKPTSCGKERTKSLSQYTTPLQDPTITSTSNEPREEEADSSQRKSKQEGTEIEPKEQREQQKTPEKHISQPQLLGIESDTLDSARVKEQSVVADVHSDPSHSTESNPPRETSGTPSIISSSLLTGTSIMYIQNNTNLEAQQQEQCSSLSSSEDFQLQSSEGDSVHQDSLSPLNHDPDSATEPNSSDISLMSGTPQTNSFTDYKSQERAPESFQCASSNHSRVVIVINNNGNQSQTDIVEHPAELPVKRDALIDSEVPVCLEGRHQSPNVKLQVEGHQRVIELHAPFAISKTAGKNPYPNRSYAEVVAGVLRPQIQASCKCLMRLPPQVPPTSSLAQSTEDASGHKLTTSIEEDGSSNSVVGVADNCTDQLSKMCETTNNSETIVQEAHHNTDTSTDAANQPSLLIGGHSSQPSETDAVSQTQYTATGSNGQPSLLKPGHIPQPFPPNPSIDKECYYQSEDHLPLSSAVGCETKEYEPGAESIDTVSILEPSDPLHSDGQGDLPPTDPLHSDGQGVLPPTDPLHSDGQGALPPTDPLNSDGQGALPPTDPLHSDGQGALPDPLHSDGQGALPPTDPLHSDGQGALPPTDPLNSDGQGVLPLIDPLNSDGQGVLPLTDPLNSDGQGVLPPTDPLHSDGQGALPPSDPLHSDGQGALPPTDPLHADSQGALPPTDPLHADSQGALPPSDPLSVESHGSGRNGSADSISLQAHGSDPEEVLRIPEQGSMSLNIAASPLMRVQCQETAENSKLASKLLVRQRSYTGQHELSVEETNPLCGRCSLVCIGRIHRQVPSNRVEQVIRNPNADQNAIVGNVVVLPPEQLIQLAPPGADQHPPAHNHPNRPVVTPIPLVTDVSHRYDNTVVRSFNTLVEHSQNRSLVNLGVINLQQPQPEIQHNEVDEVELPDNIATNTTVIGKSL